MGPFGFTVPPRKRAASVAQAANRPGDLTDSELRERAIIAMKNSTFCPRMSWRLIGDLLAVEGLRIARPGNARMPLDFVALAVLEGTIIVRTGVAGDVKPLDSPIPRNQNDNSVELVPGLYTITDAIFPQPTPPADSTRTIESPRGQVNRFYAVTVDTIRRLPAQALAGINLDKLPPRLFRGSSRETV